MTSLLYCTEVISSQQTHLSKRTHAKICIEFLYQQYDHQNQSYIKFTLITTSDKTKPQIPIKTVNHYTSSVTYTFFNIYKCEIHFHSLNSPTNIQI